MKKLLIGAAISSALMIGGSALAFSPSQNSQLQAAGYVPGNNQPWNYVYTKINGACKITITESGNKYDVKSVGPYKTEIWPVSASHLLAAANLVEAQCVTP